MAKYENPYSEMDIMLLILLAASRINRALSFSELWNLVFVDNEISYFDYFMCLDKLVKNGQMNRLEGDMYSITEDGRKNGAILEDRIPKKLKPLIEQSARDQKAIERREASIKSEIELRSNGEYMVTLGLDDGVDCIFRLSLVAPTAESADEIKTRFRKNPEAIFSDILASIFKEREKKEKN
ncbi:MAG: DUF4364 family protein [Ruminococcaceae bacterium]|nr:DUF4364 family protein [Oscillospiraceae bacterium]